jgi:hypothetical protein
MWAAFSGDSCVRSRGGSRPECVAVGTFLRGNAYAGLAESSDGGNWTRTRSVGTPPAPNNVTYGFEVSCALVPHRLPACLMVGQHYNFGKAGVQLAEWGGPKGFRVVDARNPAGATWSAMQDVACPAPNFCMIVGSAGRSKTSYATAYQWNGRSMRQLRVPAPPRSHNAQLGALACATSRSCVAVGSYQNPSGAFRSFAAIWHNGKWMLQAVPNVAGETATFFNAVSCANAASCTAVGGTEHGSGAHLVLDHAVAEQWSGGKWRIATMPLLAQSALTGVSCLPSGICFAVGWSGYDGIIEQWTKVGGWTVMQTLGTGSAANVYFYGHISCVSATFCAAVGERYNAKFAFSTRTLAERWNGTTWTLQSSANN